jgi:hypothetical protein
LRVVLVVGIFVGLGAVPLWAMVLSPTHGLVLGAGHRLGTVLGVLEIYR